MFHPLVLWGRAIDSDDYNIVQMRLVGTLERSPAPKQASHGYLRSLQLVNVAFGGALNQHYDNHWQELAIWYSHSIRTEKDSVVERLLVG